MCIYRPREKDLHCTNSLLDTGCHTGRYVYGHNLINIAYANKQGLKIHTSPGKYEITQFGSAHGKPAVNLLRWCYLIPIFFGYDENGKYVPVSRGITAGKSPAPGSNRYEIHEKAKDWKAYQRGERISELKGKPQMLPPGITAQAVPWLCARDSIVLGESTMISIGYSPYGPNQDKWGTYLLANLSDSMSKVGINQSNFGLHVVRSSYMLQNEACEPDPDEDRLLEELGKIQPLKDGPEPEIMKEFHHNLLQSQAANPGIYRAVNALPNFGHPTSASAEPWNIFASSSDNRQNATPESANNPMYSEYSPEELFMGGPICARWN